MKNGGTGQQVTPSRTAPSGTSGGETAGATETAGQSTETKQPAAGQTTETGQQAGSSQPVTPTEVSPAASKPEAKGSESSTRRETEPTTEPASKPSAGLVYGKMFVTSVPTGAQISVDGHSDPDWVTPHTIDGLKGGEHKVTLSEQGYSSSTQSVTVDPGRTTAVNLTLAQFNAPAVQTHPVKPAAQPKTQEAPPTQTTSPTNAPASASGSGILAIKTTPPGADVYIDGKSVGPSPVSVTLPAGEHTYSIKINGVEVYSSQVKLGPGDVKGAQVTLGPD